MSHNLSNTFLTVNLVRHAQSQNNTIAASLRKTISTQEEYYKQYEEVRESDPMLSQKGFNQANTLAAHLAKTHISKPLRLFCSGLQRAINTAQCLSGPLGVTPELWVDIFEEGGIYMKDPTIRSGKTVDEIEAMGVKVPSEFKTGLIANATEKGWWNHDRETYEQCVERAHSVINKLKELADFYAGQKMTLWIVSHGDFLSVLLGVLLKVDPNAPRKQLYFFHDNCGVTQFFINSSGEVKVTFINRNITPFGEPAATDSPASVTPPSPQETPL